MGASNALDSVGPNATLLGDNLQAGVRRRKDEGDGKIEVGGNVLAQSLSELGLIDEYRIYRHPVVLGSGTPFYAAAHL